MQKYWLVQKPFIYDVTLKAGLAYMMTDSYQIIRQQSNTIWDIIDSTWGVCILCFTIVLSKISNFINLKRR